MIIQGLSLSARFTLTPPPAPPSGGGYHSTAIKTDGTLWVWGNNGIGGLGTNDTTHRSSPVQTLVGGTNWRAVTAGLKHTTAIRSS